MLVSDKRGNPTAANWRRHRVGATGVRISGGSGSPRRIIPQLLRELIFGLAGVLVYFGVRGLMSHSDRPAVNNAEALVSFEKMLRFYWEPAWQALIIDHQYRVTLANWAYIYLHWPAITVVAVWLFLRHRAEYFVYRNAFLISGAIGLLLFVLFPVAPPRLVELGLTDTITAQSNAYRILQPPAFTNQYAAFPSLHFGWNLLIGLAIFGNAQWWIVRGIGLALPVIMLFAIVSTANHFLIDALAGGTLCVTALSLVRWSSASRSGVARSRTDVP
jgi:hypothetical protein